MILQEQSQVHAIAAQSELVGALKLHNLGGAVTGVWPAANKAYYWPVSVRRYFGDSDGSVAITRMAWINGNTSTGNIDAGIYDINGNKLSSTGTVAQGTANVRQIANLANPVLLLPRRLYFFAMAVDSGTTQIMRNTGISAVELAIMGAKEQTSAFNLPSTATFTAITDAYVPVFGGLTALGS